MFFLLVEQGLHSTSLREEKCFMGMYHNKKGVREMNCYVLILMFVCKHFEVIIAGGIESMIYADCFSRLKLALILTLFSLSIPTEICSHFYSIILHNLNKCTASGKVETLMIFKTG